MSIAAGKNLPRVLVRSLPVQAVQVSQQTLSPTNYVDHAWEIVTATADRNNYSASAVAWNCHSAAGFILDVGAGVPTGVGNNLTVIIYVAMASAGPPSFPADFYPLVTFTVTGIAGGPAMVGSTGNRIPGDFVVVDFRNNSGNSYFSRMWSAIRDR